MYIYIYIYIYILQYSGRLLAVSVIRPSLFVVPENTISWFLNIHIFGKALQAKPPRLYAKIAIQGWKTNENKSTSSES